MAIETAHPAPAPHAQPAEKAIFTLSEPIKDILDGKEVDIHGMEMRALDERERPLLDRYPPHSFVLAQHLIAALCDITLDQVLQLQLEDFVMLAEDAIWQANQLRPAAPAAA
ncbi:hypothetical protein [Novosphingobium colocasiae]|uniref:hypothetical protein n=1 Tax=Novosphingobium colocasiae TaxID=1256513 RepID=UPI0035AE8AC3